MTSDDSDTEGVESSSQTNPNEIALDEATSNETLTSDVSAPRPRRRSVWLIEWAAVIAFALVLALIFRTYVAQTFYIPSISMSPTLQIGDRIMVSKLSVTWGTISRGEIVVFRAPSDVASICANFPETYLVKRVIGLPGDHLRNVGTTIYYGQKSANHILSEPWRHSISFGQRNIAPNFVVPRGQYFMIGDNNDQSCDSRYWGTIPRSAIIGKVFLRIWPLSRVAVL